MEDQALERLFADPTLPRALIMEVLDRLGKWSTEDLLQIPEMAKAVNGGETQLLVEWPLLDLAGGIHTVWARGYTQGLKDAQQEVSHGS